LSLLNLPKNWFIRVLGEMMLFMFYQAKYYAFSFIGQRPCLLAPILATLPLIYLSIAGGRDCHKLHRNW